MAGVNVIADASSMWMIIVAVDRYAGDEVEQLPGPVPDAVRLLDWARAVGIPSNQIRLHISSRSPFLDEERPQLESRLTQLGFVPRYLSADEYAAGAAPLGDSELLVLDAKKTTVDESLRQLGRLEPDNPNAQVFVFLLGHGVLLLDEQARVFLTEEFALDNPLANLPLDGVEGSLATALAQVRFSEVFVFFDACSKAAFGRDQRQRIRAGQVGIGVVDPNPNTAVTVVAATTIYEAAGDARGPSPFDGGTPFTQSLLAAIHPDGAMNDFVALDDSDRFVIDLRAVVEQHIAADLRSIVGADQVPIIHQLNTREGRSVIPLLHLQLDLDPEAFRERRLSEQAQQRYLTTDPVSTALDHLAVAVRMRHLHYRASALRDSAWSIEGDAAGVVDGDEGRWRDLVLASAEAAARDMTSESVSALNEMLIPEDLRGSLMRAIGALRREIAGLGRDGTPDRGLRRYIDRLTTLVLVPLRMAAEAAFANTLWDGLHLFIRDPDAITPEVGREAAALWAYADDGEYLSARAMVSIDLAATTVPGVNPLQWQADLDRVRLAQIAVGEGERRPPSVARLADYLEQLPSERERQAAGAAYRSVADDMRTLVLGALAARSRRFPLHGGGR